MNPKLTISEISDAHNQMARDLDTHMGDKLNNWEQGFVAGLVATFEERPLYVLSDRQARILEDLAELWL
jgi:hypothetical protein